MGIEGIIDVIEEMRFLPVRLGIEDSRNGCPKKRKKQRKFPHYLKQEDGLKKLCEQNGLKKCLALENHKKGGHDPGKAYSFD